MKFRCVLASFVVPFIYWASIPPATAATATFNFDTDTVGTATTFSDTNNGVTATFSSPSDPGGFVVGASFLTTLTGNILFSPGPAGANNIPLNISFSQPITSISFLFALDTNNAAITMQFSDNAGGSASTTGTIRASGFSEGSLSFGGAAFTSVTLSSSALNLAVDDIVVSPVPLPAALPLFATGLGALGLLGWRRKRKGVTA